MGVSAGPCHACDAVRDHLRRGDRQVERVPVRADIATCGNSGGAWSNRSEGDGSDRDSTRRSGGQRPAAPQRRTGGGRLRLSGFDSAMASRIAASRLPACHLARAPSREVQRRAVVHRGTHERQAERDVHGVGEVVVLQHRQALIVVHGEHRVRVRELRRDEGGVRGYRAAQAHPSCRKSRITGSITSISSRPRCPDSPAWGFRPRTRIRGSAMPNVLLQIVVQHFAALPSTARA